MPVECFHIDYDHRLEHFVVSGRADYGWYLNVTRGSEENLKIQRDIIKSQKTYATLRQDLKRGCVLPPVVLGVQGILLPDQMPAEPADAYFVAAEDSLLQVQEAISALDSGAIQIIDGLQRTNAIRSVASELDGEPLETFRARPLRFEAWINIRLDALAYRMLLLNAGQKPMSMKHQIEILGDSMRTSLSDIEGLEIIRGIDKRRRTQPGQFQLAILTGAFQAWLQKSPNVDLRNAITEQLLADDAIEELGQGLAPGAHSTGARFNDFVKWLVDLDQALGQNNLQFLGNETVVHAAAAAISKAASSQSMEERCQRAQERLLREIREAGPEAAFGIVLFTSFRDEIDPKKQNVGDAIRLLVFRALSEYIVSDGTATMPEAWTFASQYLK